MPITIAGVQVPASIEQFRALTWRDRAILATRGNGTRFYGLQARGRNDASTTSFTRGRLAAVLLEAARETEAGVIER